MKKYLYLMCGIQIFLRIYLCFIAIKYASVESVMGSWLYVILTGIIMIYLIFKSDKTQKLLLFVHPIGLIIICIFIFTSIPVYSYKVAVEMIENSTGEKSIKPQDYKAANRYYYIYTVNETYLFEPWSGRYAVIDFTPINRYPQ